MQIYSKTNIFPISCMIYFLIFLALKKCFKVKSQKLAASTSLHRRMDYLVKVDEIGTDLMSVQIIHSVYKHLDEEEKIKNRMFKIN